MHVLGVGETWLLNADSSSFVSLDGFALLRSDVHGTVRKHGVAAYISNSLKFEEIEVDVPNVIVLKLLDFSLIIVVVYRPPSYNDLENNKLCNFF